MKIIAVGRNYADHISELNNERPAEPVIFLKPDTAVLRSGQPFYHPSFSNDIHYECELIFKIGKEGKFIEPNFAHRYVEAISLGIDFTARDIQEKLKAKGLPWELAKSFNHSAVIGEWQDPSHLPEWNAIPFELKLNGETRQQGNSANMIFTLPEIIAFVSRYFTLKKGDVIFTGTPKGVAAIKPGDQLKGYLYESLVLEVEVK